MGMQTECLVIGGPDTTISASVRFLQLVGRLVGQYATPQAEWPAEGVDSVPDRRMPAGRGTRSSTPGKRPIEQTIDLGESNLEALALEPMRREFAHRTAARSAAAARPRGNVRGRTGRASGDALRARSRSVPPGR